MKNKKIIITSISIIICILLIFILSILVNNKTFFKNKYIGVNNQEIFIPKYSLFNRECGMTVAEFYSLKSKKELKKEINNYMKDFEYFKDESTYGYKNGNIFIQSYEVVNRGLYRKIYITY